MRTLAIGDVHGCFDALETLASFVPFRPSDRIILLGDIVDRGPQTNSVIQWVLDRRTNDVGPTIVLRGNHEVMMVDALTGRCKPKEWLSSGGQAVLNSYGADEVEELPEEHLNFLQDKLRPYLEDKDHFFVHANVSPELDLDEQPDYMLYWEPLGDPPPHHSGRTMVCGHTPQKNGLPLDIGHAICIDTAACKGGWLTCLDPDERYCWQANQEGLTRQFWLNAPVTAD